MTLIKTSNLYQHAQKNKFYTYDVKTERLFKGFSSNYNSPEESKME